MPPVPTIDHDGNKIRLIRMGRGMSIAELAEHAGITPQALSNIELNTRRLSLTLAQRLAVELRVDLSDITCDPDGTSAVPCPACPFRAVLVRPSNE
jgi:transcriptional regulator with XRE-family HTH domain